MDWKPAFRAEEHRFSPKALSHAPHTIHTVIAGFDRHGDWTILFDTPSNTFGLFVILAQSPVLSWKESHAVADCMALAQRGNQLTPSSFTTALARFSLIHGRVDLPTHKAGRLVAGLYPAPAPAPTSTSAHRLVWTSLSFDKDDDLVLRAKTLSGSVFSVCLQLVRSANRFGILDSRALIDVLAALETGNAVSRDSFLAFALALRSKFNVVRPYESSQPPSIHLTVFPTSVPDPTPASPLLHSTAARIITAKNSLPSPTPPAQPEPLTEDFQDDVTDIDDTLLESTPPSYQQVQSPSSNPNLSADMLHKSPYPGITFVRALKSSGQAQVFAGKRKGLDVAIKVFTDGDANVSAYKQELRLLLKMSSHPNVVRVLDFFDTPRPALVMELVDGHDLRDFLRSQKQSLPMPEAMKLASGIASGLVHLHKHGIVHRDLKTANILRRRDGSPVIIDLGLSSVQEQHTQQSDLTINQVCSAVSDVNLSAQQTAIVKGTVLWMAPEMITERRWSDKTDVYALAIILWEIFSGKDPMILAGPNPTSPLAVMIAIAKGKRPPLSAIEHVDPKLRTLIETCWDEDPAKRPSMRRVLDCLSGNDPKRVFEAMDVDKSGRLEFAEFAMFLQRYAPGVVSPQHIYPLFASIDADKSGDIGYEEFERFWRLIEIYGVDGFLKQNEIFKSRLEARPRGGDDWANVSMEQPLPKSTVYKVSR